MGYGTIAPMRTVRTESTQIGADGMKGAWAAGRTPDIEIEMGREAFGAKGVTAAKGAGLAGKAAGTKAAAGGTIWTGKSLGLGLGLGLGAWGSAIVALVGATAIYGYLRSRKAEKEQSDEEAELR